MLTQKEDPVWPHHDDTKNTFIKLMEEGKWPNLQQVTKSFLDGNEELLELRPHLTWELNVCVSVGSDEPFEKEWLQWDPITLDSLDASLANFLPQSIQETFS